MPPSAEVVSPIWVAIYVLFVKLFTKLLIAAEK